MSEATTGREYVISTESGDLIIAEDQLSLLTTEQSALVEAVYGEINIRWRDNGSTAWKNEHPINMGLVGDATLIKQLTANGYYATRQYEITVSSNIPVIVVGFEENVEALDK